MSAEQGPTEEQVEAFRKALGDAGKEFQAAIAWARTSFAIGNSFMRYRSGELDEASLAVHALPSEQRDMVYRWAAWLVGAGLGPDGQGEPNGG